MYTGFLYCGQKYRKLIPPRPPSMSLCVQCGPRMSGQPVRPAHYSPCEPLPLKSPPDIGHMWENMAKKIRRDFVNTPARSDHSSKNIFYGENRLSSIVKRTHEHNDRCPHKVHRKSTTTRIRLPGTGLLNSGSAKAHLND